MHNKKNISSVTAAQNSKSVFVFRMKFIVFKKSLFIIKHCLRFFKGHSVLCLIYLILYFIPFKVHICALSIIIL